MHTNPLHAVLSLEDLLIGDDPVVKEALALAFPTSSTLRGIKRASDLSHKSSYADMLTAKRDDLKSPSVDIDGQSARWRNKDEQLSSEDDALSGIEPFLFYTGK